MSGEDAHLEMDFEDRVAGGAQLDDDYDDGPWYCPHGVEVEVPGGACHRCALEDADDSDY